MTNYLYDGLFENAKPDAPLAILGDGKVRSYGWAKEMSARLANVLTGLGVKPADRVAVQVPKSIEAVMLYIACVRAGAIFLPLNTAYTVGEIDYFLSDSGASLFVCDPEKLESMKSVAERNHAQLETLGMAASDGTGGGSLAKAAENAPAEFENVARGPNDLAAILYTSGTTGRSKGAMLSHDNLLSNAQTLMDLWRFTSSDALLHALPIFHTHGLFVATNVTLLAGSSMIFLPGFQTDAMIANMGQVTTMMGVPTFYTRLLEDPRFTKDLVAHMRLFVSGSAPLLADTHTEFEARTGHRIIERYGMTETNMNTSNPYEGERRPGTVGFPLPGVELRICHSETGQEVEKGGVGIIEVRGPNVFSGYWQMPEKTAEDFRDDGFFITGDMGTFDEDGYLQIVGREKDLIISGGYNIYPKEIELLLDERDGVSESAVIGVPHPDFGEGVVGVVVPAANDAIDPNMLLDAIKPKIARFKQPKKLFLVDELPRNTMGKVQKNLLRERYKGLFKN